MSKHLAGLLLLQLHGIIAGLSLLQLYMHKTSCEEVRHHLHDSSGLRDMLRLCLARLLRQHLLRLQGILHGFHVTLEREKAGQCQEVQ